MPVDKGIVKPTEIQKLTNRYQDVNKNKVKFKGEIPVDEECENNKQKNGNTDKRKNGYHTSAGNGLDENIQLDNR